MQNRRAFEYNKQTIDSLSSICSPLLDNFPFKTFGYRKFFDDGRYLAMSNNLKWQEYYFSQIKDPNPSFSKAIFEARPEHFTHFIWPQHPKEPIFQALYEHDIWHGVSIYRRRQEFVECFAFATTRDCPLVNSLSQADLQSIKEFIEYFSSEGHDLIFQCPTNAFGKFDQFQIDSSVVANKSLDPSFLGHRSLSEKFKFNWQGKDYDLTTQEYKCLYLIACGYNTKEIAEKLSASPRTIEIHVSKIFSKFAVHTRSELIKIFHHDESVFLQQSSSCLFKNIRDQISVNKFYLDEKSYFTKRELDCAKRLVVGDTAKEVARYLTLSPRTVETYIENIKRKTKCHYKSQLIRELVKLGVIEVISKI